MGEYLFVFGLYCLHSRYFIALCRFGDLLRLYLRCGAVNYLSSTEIHSHCAQVEKFTRDAAVL